MTGRRFMTVSPTGIWHQVGKTRTGQFRCVNELVKGQRCRDNRPIGQPNGPGSQRAWRAAEKVGWVKRLISSVFVLLQLLIEKIQLECLVDKCYHDLSTMVFRRFENRSLLVIRTQIR